MSKKKTKQQTSAEYYQLHTDAVESLVNATSENAPEYSKEELSKYRSGKKRWRIPETLKVLLIKFWFYGAICYFVFMGLGLYLTSTLDLCVVAAVICGMVTDLLINHFLRFTEKLPGGNKNWMMVTRKGAAGLLLNILYGFVLIFMVLFVYTTLNALLQPAGQEKAVVALPVEPLLFGVFTTALDTAFVGMKRGFMRIVADAKEKVDNGR